MFLKNSWLFFLLPLIFLFQNDFYLPRQNENVYVVSKNFLEDLKPLDSFSLEKSDGTYYYKVIKKVYWKMNEPLSFEESKVYFFDNENRDLHLLVIAISTGKLIKKQENNTNLTKNSYFFVRKKRKSRGYG